MYCVKLHKSTNLKMCLRLTEMYSSLFAWGGGGGGLMGHKYQFFCQTILYFFPKRTLVITISDQVLH